MCYVSGEKLSRQDASKQGITSLVQIKDKTMERARWVHFNHLTLGKGQVSVGNLGKRIDVCGSAHQLQGHKTHNRHGCNTRLH